MNKLLPKQLKGGPSPTKQIITARYPSDWPRGFIKFINIYIILLHLIVFFGAPIFISELGCGEVLDGDRMPCITDGEGLLPNVYIVLFILYFTQGAIPFAILLISTVILTSGSFFPMFILLFLLGFFIVFSLYNALCKFFLAVLVISIVWSSIALQYARFILL